MAISNAKTGFLAAALAVSMVGVGFAAVPLYRIFCQVTGFGGTTMRVDAAQAATVAPTNKTIVIRFDANHRGDLPWDFKPERPTDTVTIGAKDMSIFLAKNLSGEVVTGTATFNVTPELAGKYFNKIQCFCFTEQSLKPGQQVRMPVLYYVDPKIMTDPETKDIEEITLSYTFYPVEKPIIVDQTANGG
ncbi:MAG: cytochrome c oxidase assembly protein [Sphingomonadaceae bacterium]|nr:cytochrome c oxidase assembly protein [Sphingomonadaceae bacterium]MBJ7388207.1 cytochrome c oxidase assembly protein [Sphingomonadaceae bacterium]MBJ7526674.1 cytochrome c oxidase assembly protein [Sphingomonadaceae bacterium]